jgi:predicted HNH restriction endonuclease
MRRNGAPYLEIHHIRALAEGGADHPLNVAAVCPNCHSRVTHGKDADEYNALIAVNVKTAETKLESEAK